MKKDKKKKVNVTVKDIADSIDISASTVSRALNNHPKISQSTKEKVWAAAKKLGYQPNIPAYMNPENSKTILYTLDPEMIVLGGKISKAFPYFEKMMFNRINFFRYKHSLKDLKIMQSQQSGIAILDAAALFYDA